MESHQELLPSNFHLDKMKNQLMILKGCKWIVTVVKKCVVWIYDFVNAKNSKRSAVSS